MLTRSKALARQGGSGLTSSRQAESRLDLALRELKATKEEVAQLIGEREENEKELLDLLDKCKKLKQNLSELHTQHVIVVEERDKLQTIIDGFGECSQEYVHNLRRVTLLEQELRDAHHHIGELESEKKEFEQEFIACQTDSLFEELIGSVPSLTPNTGTQNPIVTIDLTSDNTMSHHNNGVVKCSRSKLKKYVRINRYIKKTQKLVNKQRCFYNNLKCIRERQRLGNELDLYTLALDNNITKHEDHVKQLESQINNLKDSLDRITKRYICSKKENEEHVMALKHLMNASLTDCNDRHSLGISNRSQPTCDSSFSSQCSNNKTVYSTNQNNSSFARSKYVVKNKIVMFSDEFGKNMGLLLSNYLGQPIINHCLPNTSYHKIISNILKYPFEKNTTLIIMIADRGNVIKKQFTKYFDCLSALEVNNIIMFTLPYSHSLPHTENDYRYKINLTMSTLTCNNYNNNKIHIVDCNNLTCN